ncbi:MAG: aspartyl-phosphate phosphatase Spo0E family protein [Blautia sp.]|uniref:aspartyl-phosphate phosphatase Spo0E family protein n=1 Tax=Blautia sp. TaxID=1955243 RepID=UPI002E79A5B4|nr:aspartyl-phosphate phosphatase Spo0E family protein [Blautia sp.]MEE1442090.1 aspartyl-phosphate phosphatase Spo0E family protein [Blautia sp.]
MTQKELKWEIEHTREKLDAAIEQKYCFLEILNISRMLDCLIEEYMTMNQQSCS